MPATAINNLQSVSFETYQQYPHEYTEFWREMLAALIAPYKKVNEELRLTADETVLHLAHRGTIKAVIRELQPDGGVHPYTVRYAEKGVQYIPKATDISAGLFTGAFLDSLPGDVLAGHCSNVDRFLGRVGSLNNWTVSGEYERQGSKVSVAYPR